ncbi:hypothetical protein [Streptomyces sp. NPDC058620]|uniref:LexA family protein n=1 Tax=Streptomyces sp. NPDC058620 TaxID=3346560 RepID=UPI0036568D03
MRSLPSAKFPTRPCGAVWCNCPAVLPCIRSGAPSRDARQRRGWSCGARSARRRKRRPVVDHLTERQERILRCITGGIAERGEAPSVREVGQRSGCRARRLWRISFAGWNRPERAALALLPHGQLTGPLIHLRMLGLLSRQAEGATESRYRESRQGGIAWDGRLRSERQRCLSGRTTIAVCACPVGELQ